MIAMAMSSLQSLVLGRRKDEKVDDKGAIMVLGIFMACAMAGMMWMMVGLGDAVIWRDRTQEAADAMAFTSASVHARAMNLIAFMNLIMFLMTVIYLAAALLYNISDFILVIVGRNDVTALDLPWPFKWKGFKGAVSQCRYHQGILTVLGAVLSEFGGGVLVEIASYFCPIAGYTQPVHDTLGRFLRGSGWSGADDYAATGQPGGWGYENVMSQVMPRLADAQIDLAIYAPYAGMVMGSLVGWKDYVDFGHHRYGTAISSSLTRGKGVDLSQRNKFLLISDFADRPTIPNVNEWDVNGQKFDDSKDMRLGLPVQEQHMKDLCDRAVGKVTGAISGALSFLSFAQKLIDFLLNGIKDHIVNGLCTNDDKGIFDPVDTGIAKAWQFFDWLWFFNKGAQDPDHEMYHWDVKDRGHFWEDDLVGGPKVIVPYAQNGNDWMQVYSFALGQNRPGGPLDFDNGPFNDKDLKKVSAADINQYGSGPGAMNPIEGALDLATNVEAKASSIVEMYSAQAEFYYDCDKTWDDDACNKDDNAMYGMNWRTRLRRVHYSTWLSTLFDMYLQTGFGSSFDSAVTTWVGDTAPFKAVKNALDTVGGGGLVDKLISKAWEFVKGKGVDIVKGMLNSQSVDPDLIH